MFRARSFVDDCILLQSDTEHVQGSCTADFMQLNSSKTRGTVFSRESNVLYYTYKLWDTSNTCTETITDLGVNSTQNCISTHMWTVFSPNQ
jgi:hypothetical protein